MLRTRAVVVLSLLCLTLAATLQAAPVGARFTINSQQGQALIVEEDAKRGIELYRAGDDKAAIESLRRAIKARRDVVAASHFLGLAYERQNKLNDARKAHEQAAKAGELMLDLLFTSLATGKVTSDQEQLKLLLKFAAESADKYLQLTSNPSKSRTQEWKSRAEALRDYASLSVTTVPGSTSVKIYAPTEVTRRARILQRREEPEYTEEARKNQVSGTVVLRAVIAFDGKLRAIRVMNGLPHGLTERAIEAARKIKFAPALLNGQAVSQYIQIEYNFNLY